MTLETHLTFNRTITLNGVLACECTKDDALLFQEAYLALFPQAKIEVWTAFQLAKKRRQEKEEVEQVEVES